jgi:hypothetical protein
MRTPHRSRTSFENTASIDPSHVTHVPSPLVPLQVTPNHPRTKQVFPGAEVRAVARSQPVKPVRFDPKLNGRMPLEFLSAIEPSYASLHEYLQKKVNTRGPFEGPGALEGGVFRPVSARVLSLQSIP